MYMPCDLSSLQQARTNVPGLSERTLQRDIASSGILTGAGIQVQCVNLQSYKLVYSYKQ